MLRTLLAWKRGEPRVCSMVVPPSPEQEDHRRICRERAVLQKERVRHVNSIKGLLAGQGITAGYETIGGLSWTAGHVQLFRNDHHLLVYREGERIDRGELMLNEVVEELGVSKMTVIRMIHTKTLPAHQVCPGAPYVILRKDLELPGVRTAPPLSPASADIRQTAMELQ
jgi:excisionase family DNA binding protein